MRDGTGLTHRAVYRTQGDPKMPIMKTVIAVSVLSLCAGAASAADMRSILPDAKPGECYARVMIPAKYEERLMDVVVREASERVEITPPQYKWENQRVQVSDASVRFEVVPARFRTVTESLETAPAESKWVAGSIYSSVEASAQVLSSAANSGAALESAANGQCFAEYFQPPVYETVTQQVMVSEPSENISIVPARYEWMEEQQIVAEASRQLVEIPASYETVTERVMVEEAKVVWKPGHGDVERIDQHTGNVMCLVELPPVYKNVEKRVLKAATSTKVVEVPAKYESVRVRKLVEPARQVRVETPARYRDVSVTSRVSEGSHFWREDSLTELADGARKTGNVICRKDIPAKVTSISKLVVEVPASVREVEVPARFENRRVRQLVSAAVETRVQIPEEIRQVSKRVKVSDLRMAWQPVLCETNTTQGTIERLQRALNGAGYDTGAVDGQLSAETLNAVDQFQRDNGMASGGLTLDVLNKLGVSPG